MFICTIMYDCHELIIIIIIIVGKLIRGILCRHRADTDVKSIRLPLCHYRARYAIITLIFVIRKNRRVTG